MTRDEQNSSTLSKNEIANVRLYVDYLLNGAKSFVFYSNTLMLLIPGRDKLKLPLKWFTNSALRPFCPARPRQVGDGVRLLPLLKFLGH